MIRNRFKKRAIEWLVLLVFIAAIFANSLALLLIRGGSTIGLAGNTGTQQVSAAAAPDYVKPDYIADKYGVTNHVFEVITVEMLWRLLTKTGTLASGVNMTGTSLIVFADSTLATSKAAIPALNTYAKDKGVSKIFYVDMLLVGGEYDANVNIWDSEAASDYWFIGHHETGTQLATSTSGAAATQTVKIPSESHPSQGSAVTTSYIAMGLLIKAALGNQTTALYPDEYPASFNQDLRDYTAATDTLLFSFTRTDSSAASVTETALLKTADLTGGAITNGAAYKTSADLVLDEYVNASNKVIYSHYDFTRVDFGAPANASQTVLGGTSDNTEAGRRWADDIFNGVTRANFKVVVVPYYVVRYIMEDVPGDHDFYFGGSWCGDSQAQYPIVISNLQKYNTPALYNFDFRLAGNMTLTSAVIPTAYRGEDGTRWSSLVEDEGDRTAIASGVPFYLDGVLTAAGDSAIAANSGNLSTNNRDVITRTAHLGMELCHLMAGGRFLPPVLGNHFASTNLREQYVVGGAITVTGESGSRVGSFERGRTTYKRFLSPHLFRFRNDAASNTHKQIAQWSSLIEDWSILRTTAVAGDPGGLQFNKQDVYKSGEGWTYDVEQADVDGQGNPIVLRESDVGKYIDMENGGPFTNQQRALGRYSCSEFFGGAIVNAIPHTATADYLVNTKIKNDIDVSGGGCGGDPDPVKNRPNGDNQKLIPNQGTTDYDVLGQWSNNAPDKFGYNIEIEFTGTLSKNTEFTGKTTITATANKALTEISLDFRKINVTGVTIAVGGGAETPAAYERVNDNSVDKQKLNVTGVSIAKGQEFVVTVNYTLRTLDYAIEQGLDVNELQGFTMHADGKGASALGEPVAAPYWFPCNNRPGDTATYSLTLKAPTAYQKVGPGVPVGTWPVSTTAESVTWNVKQPVAAYQVFATFSSNLTNIATVGGSNVGTQVPLYTTIDGRSIPYYIYVNNGLYNANTAANRTRDKADMFFGKLPYYIRTLEKLLGPYPGESIGFVFEVLGDGEGGTVDTAIETKDRPFFSYADIVSEDTFVHELTHQWFGDSVTMESWEHLWLHEGFAIYATDLFYEYTSTIGYKAHDKWLAVYNGLPANHLFWTGGAPANILDEVALFDGPRFAYYGGGMALQVLRDGIGDAAFFEILSTWAVRGGEGFGGKSATTADFIAFAESVSGVDLTEWADTWLYGKVKPATFTLTGADSSDPGNPVIEPGQQAAAFKAANADVLALNPASVKISDKTAIEAAKAAYNNLDNETQALLADEIGLINGLLDKITELENAGNGGLPAGAIVGIVAGSVAVAGTGIFALWRFVFRKKKI